MKLVQKFSSLPPSLSPSLLIFGPQVLVLALFSGATSGSVQELMSSAWDRTELAICKANAVIPKLSPQPFQTLFKAKYGNHGNKSLSDLYMSFSHNGREQVGAVCVRPCKALLLLAQAFLHLLHSKTLCPENAAWATPPETPGLHYMVDFEIMFDPAHAEVFGYGQTFWAPTWAGSQLQQLQFTSCLDLGFILQLFCSATLGLDS